MKKICALTSFIAVFLFAGAAHATEHVITVYFSGTSMHSEMHDPLKSAFGRAETVASLHHFQKGLGQDDVPLCTDSPCHHKIIVDGFSGVHVINPTPDAWSWQSGLALTRVTEILSYTPGADDSIILNLVGFSRGGPSAMHFLDLILKTTPYSTGDMISQINILTFDPVPGDTDMESSIFNLPPKASFIGFYALDERSLGFAPVFPHTESAASATFFSVPGSHETMVGSIMRSGHLHHNIPTIAHVPELDYLSRTLKIFATEIMGGSQWGHVRFDASDDSDLNLHWYDAENQTVSLASLKEDFAARVDAIWSGDLPEIYYDMHNDTFVLSELLPLMQSWQEIGGTETCALADNRARFDKPRCAYFMDRGGEDSGEEGSGFPGGKLGEPNWKFSIIASGNASPPLRRLKEGDMEVAWNLIYDMGSLDIDADLVDYSEDNCPVKANSDQLNHDFKTDTAQGDIQGDMCDTCTDFDGDGFGDPGFELNECPVDNCPLIKNTEQKDFDGDLLGDACDLDDDDDGVLDEDDLCPETLPGTVVALTGCSLVQLAPCDGPRGGARHWLNHGEYVSTLSRFARTFSKEGLVTHKERGRIVSRAAKSTCGAR